MKSLIQKLQAERVTLLAKLQSSSSSNTSATEELSSLTSETTKLTSELDALRSKVTSSQSELSDLCSSIAEQRQKKSDLLAAIAHETAIADRLDEVARNLTKEVEGINVEASSVAIDIVKVDGIRGEHEAEANITKGEIQTLEGILEGRINARSSR